MDPRIIQLFDSYTHGGISRRAFLDRLATLAGSTAAAMALLPLIENNYTAAAQVAPDDPRLAIDSVSYDTPVGKVSGYLARLREPRQQRPAVIVIHENRGLNPFVQDVARRLAVEGFLAYAVDLLSPEGGTPADEDAARAMIAKLDHGVAIKRLVAAVPFLSFHRESNSNVGAVGFCWGGGMVDELATASRDLKAGVAYYGDQIAGEKVGHIRARLLLHYAELDPRINAGIAAYEAVLKTAGKRYKIYMYPGAHHSFANDTSPARHDKKAAELAWNRTVAFLNEYLK